MMSEKDEKDHEHEIIVNGRPKKWDAATISFEQVVELAFPGAPPSPNRIYTATWKAGHEHGSLVSGQDVAVRPGMIFNVTATDKS